MKNFKYFLFIGLVLTAAGILVFMDPVPPPEEGGPGKKTENLQLSVDNTKVEIKNRLDDNVGVTKKIDSETVKQEITKTIKDLGATGGGKAIAETEYTEIFSEAKACCSINSFKKCKREPIDKNNPKQKEELFKKAAKRTRDVYGPEIKESILTE